ncbi:MAG: flagellar motor switch protein FliN/FliY, partial [Planctomycetaceae bacterium]
QALLDKANGGGDAAADAAPPGDATQPADNAPAGDAPTAAAEEMSVEDRANQLLNEVDAGLEAAVTGTPMKGPNVRAGIDDAKPFEYAEFGSDADAEGLNEKAFSIGMLDDVQMSVQIELGRAELLIDEVMSMRKGVVVPLDKLAGDPIDIVVNGRLLARGEVLVLNDKFCVRVVEIVAADS